MYISSNIAKRIKSITKSKKLTVKTVLENAGLGFNTMSNMQTSMPKADNLAKIADCLDCSVDYLLGRTESETMPKTPVETETIEYYLKLDSLAKTEIDNAVRKLMTEQNKTE